MPKTIDLPRIRRALSELDRIAAEHPDLCQHQGQWDEKEVEEMIMGTPAKERVAQLRARREAQGIKRITFFCDPNAQTALLALRKAQPDLTVDATICTALIAAVTEPAPCPVEASTAPESLPLFAPVSTEPAPPLTCINADLNSLIEGDSVKGESVHTDASAFNQDLAAFKNAVADCWNSGIKGYGPIATALNNAGFRNGNGNPYSREMVKRTLIKAGLVAETGKATKEDE